MKIFPLFFLLTLLFSFSSFAESEPMIYPDEVKPFILKGYKVFDYGVGDINGDGRQDGILILEGTSETAANVPTNPDSLNRPLLLLIRQFDGKLLQLQRNDNVVLSAGEGGVFGDPYQGLSMEKNAFRLAFYGGSAERWAVSYKFSYKPEKKDWYLTEETYTTYHTSAPDKALWNYTLTEKEMMEPFLFLQFAGEYYLPPQPGRVKAKKTFFYESPELNSKPKAAFLIQGDSFDIHLETKNFYKTSFTNPKNEKITRGFILKKDVEKIPAKKN